MRHKVVMQYHFLVALTAPTTAAKQQQQWRFHHINYSAKQISFWANTLRVCSCASEKMEFAAAFTFPQLIYYRCFFLIVSHLFRLCIRHSKYKGIHAAYNICMTMQIISDFMLRTETHTGREREREMGSACVSVKRREKVSNVLLKNR